MTTKAQKNFKYKSGLQPAEAQWQPCSMYVRARLSKYVDREAYAF